ncbi:MAG TPA: protein kinase [Planctomycetota bacterium]|nr:protein kinase [Planctomycetota bacterium]
MGSSPNDRRDHERQNPPSDRTLKEIGGFEIVSKLGQGAMGAVFKARQASLDRFVALKILPQSFARDATFIERFQREARASARLNHPNVVQGIAVGKDEKTGLWYFAMELVEGPTLKAVLEEQHVLPEARATQIISDIARALECAVKNNIVHRDIKPDNILIAPTGEAKLADLGLAKNLGDDTGTTVAGQAVGTPNYMSPEQARGEGHKVDIRTDIYALGATYYHLVTGRPPFAGATGAVVMAKHLTDPPPRAHEANPKVSEACSNLIVKMMAKKREQRIQTPTELLEKLSQLSQSPQAPKSPLRARPASSETQRRAPPPPQYRKLLPLAAAGILVGIVGVGMYLNSGKSVTDTPIENSATPPAASNPQAPVPPAVAAGQGQRSWPGDRTGLLFLLAPGKPALVFHPVTKAETSVALVPRGNAKIDAQGHLDVRKGAYLISGANDLLLQACKASNELSIEASFHPDNLTQSGPARIISFSTDGSTRNFTLGQDGAKLILRLRTTKTGPNGSSPQTDLCTLSAPEMHHVIVSYSRGRLLCFLNGKQVLSSDGVSGDFSNWTPQHFLLGDEYANPRDWSGKIEAVAIYSRAIQSAEAERNYQHFKSARAK